MCLCASYKRFSVAVNGGTVAQHGLLLYILLPLRSPRLVAATSDGTVFILHNSSSGDEQPGSWGVAHSFAAGCSVACMVRWLLQKGIKHAATHFF